MKNLFKFILGSALDDYSLIRSGLEGIIPKS